MTIAKEQLLWMYHKLVQVRRFEEKAIELFQAGEMPGFLHSQIGQEAVPVGTCANLRPDDYITSTHRGHGDMIAKGARLDRMMAELYAKETGYCRGKGGSMHIFDFSLGVLGANGIVGGGIPIAVGAALAAKMQGLDRVAVAFFGDGASNEGSFHEGLNIAAIWNLPVVFVCQNNEFGESTPRSAHQKVKDIASRAIGYDLPGVVADGMDVLSVYETVGAAVERARRGEGPTLVEAKTYRFFGHYIGDPAVYRPAEEVERYRQRDPLLSFEKKLLDSGNLQPDERERIQADVDREIEGAVEFARKSPDPRPESALEHVYV